MRYSPEKAGPLPAAIEVPISLIDGLSSLQLFQMPCTSLLQMALVIPPLSTSPYTILVLSDEQLTNYEKYYDTYSENSIMMYGATPFSQEA